MTGKCSSVVCFVITLIAFFYLISGCSVESKNMKSGVFIDSPVEGIMYQTGSYLGRTDRDGTFYYEEGETVTFSVEGVVIGKTVPGKEIITPIDLVLDSNSFVTHPKVTNICRFLQSLDEDQDPLNGITISRATGEKVKEAFTSIDFSDGTFDAEVSSFFDGNVVDFPLRTPESAQAHFFWAIAEQGILPVDMIHLGDGFTNGTQSASVEIHDVSQSENVNVHQYTQVYGYPQVMANLIDSVVFSDFEWNNPLLEMDENRIKTRVTEDDTYLVPYNIAVHGATVKSLLEEKTGGNNEVIDELLLPIQQESAAEVTQLEAAQYIASQEGHENRMKLFILWVGINDVLGALTASGGGQLTETDINTFLSDTVDGHDLNSLQSNLTAIVDDLRTIQYSYVFVGNIPDVTRVGALFFKDDIESLAQFDSPEVTTLVSYEDPLPLDTNNIAIGFGAFASDNVTLQGIASILTSDNTSLNNAIQNLGDESLLSNQEADLIRTRIDEINAHIQSLVDSYGNVFLVDLNALFNEMFAVDGEIVLPNEEDTVSRGYGKGFFSMDGIHPSNTGHALIARKFIEKIINPYDSAHSEDVGIDTDKDGIGIFLDIGEVDDTIDSVSGTDPYRDIDGDGFPEGPGIVPDTEDQLTIDPSLSHLVDCDDSDNGADTLPEALTAEACQ